MGRSRAELRGRAGIGALLQALAAQHAALAAADRVGQERMERGPLCSPDIRPAAADILPNATVDVQFIYRG